jgi:peroxiredoxin
MRRAWLALSLVACASTPSPVVMTSPMDIAAALPAEQLDAAGILARMEQTYASATTYSDHGTVETSSWTLSFETAFIRDQRLRFEYSAGGRRSHWARVWSDFRHTYTEASRDREITDDGLRIGKPLAVKAGSSAGSSVLITGLLLPDLVGRSPTDDLSAPAILREETLGGSKCWVIGGQDRRGKDVSLWIDQGSYVLRKLVDDHHTIELEPQIGTRLDAANIPPPDITATPAVRRKPFLPPTLGLYLDGESTKVAFVIPGGPAFRASIVPGDTLVALDGSAMSNGGEFLRRTWGAQLGAKYVLTIEHDGVTRDVPLATEIDAESQAYADADAMVELPAPAFDLAVIAGTGSARLSDLKGKVVVLDFWSSWCEACFSSFPALKQLARDYPDVRIIGISSDTPDVIRSKAKEHNTPFTFASDPDGKVAALYKVRSYPHFVVIDASGVMRIFETGGSEMSPIPSYVRTLLR